MVGVVTGCDVMAFVVTVVLIGVTVVVGPSITSQRMPVYCDWQIHVHEFAIKNPPF
jgi:hypothetical protein